MCYLHEKINVYVIVYGDVVMKTYEHSVFPNKILALYNKGAIIGSKYDNESIKFDRWWIARVPTIAVQFDYKHFK